jgi:hypothetical protein
MYSERRVRVFNSKSKKEDGMRIEFFEKEKDGTLEKVGEQWASALYDLVSRVVRLLDILATDLVREGDDLCLYYIGQGNTPWCEKFIGFFDWRQGIELFANLLKQELYRGLRAMSFTVNITGFERGFLDDYMPRLLDNLEMDPEKKLKAVAAVLYGGARRRSDVERLMELDWKDLIAAIRIAQDEGIGAVEVLDFLKQPVAA